MNNFYRILSFSLFTYILLLLLAFLYGFKEKIPVYIYVMQIVIAISFFVMLYFCTRLKSTQSVLYVIFMTFLILTSVLRYVFWNYTNSPYNNFKSVDVYTYEGNAIRFQDNDYISFLLGTHLNIDDIGYSSVVYFLHVIFCNTDIVRIVLLLLNTVAIVVSLKYVYLICRLIDIDKRIAMSTAVFYGIFPFLIVNSTIGLKENIFCLLIVCAFYYMYTFKERKSFKSFILSMLFVCSTFLFRSAIALMLLLLYIPFLYCNENNRKRSIYWGIIGGILGTIILPFLIANFTATTMDHVSQVTAARIQKAGSSTTIQWLVQTLSSLFGPFPNFIRMAQYGILHNSGLFVKTLFGFFTIAGIYNVFKKLDYKLYPIVLYLFMGYTMLILSGVSLDMRYHVTFFVAFVILMAKGLQEYEGRTLWFYAYALGDILLIILYNVR